MKGLAVTSEGIEHICAQEITELLKTKPVQRKRSVEFTVKSVEQLILCCYSLQSCSKILLLLDQFSFKKDFFSEFQHHLKKTNFSEWLKPGNKVAVRAFRYGIHNFSSQEIEKKAGAEIVKNNKIKVALDDPEVIIAVVIIDNNCSIGIDFSGTDLSKRDYKIFSNVHSLKATIAYALSRIADSKKNEIILDPFCGSGEICIETTLHLCNYCQNVFSKDKFAFLRIPHLKAVDYESFFEKRDGVAKLKKTKVFGYDYQMKNIMAAKKNAKIAGINKLFHLSRLNVDDLELKFKKHTVDKIITHLPDIPKYDDQSQIKRVIDDFFYQAEYILKPKGIIAVISREDKAIHKSLEKYKFKITNQHIVWQGKQKLIISIIKKEK